MDGNRVLLLQAAAVVALGGIALMRPTSAAAASSVMFDGCAVCLPNGCPSDPEAECRHLNCDWQSVTNCQEAGSCTAPKAVLYCETKPAE